MSAEKPRLTIKYPRISCTGLTITEIYGAVVEPFVVSADQLEVFLNKLRREVDDKVFDYQLKNDGLVTENEKLKEQVSSMESENALSADSFHAYEIKVEQLEQKVKEQLRDAEKYRQECLRSANIQLNALIKELEECKVELSKRSAASYFMRNVQLATEIESLQAKLKIATEALKTIHIGVDPRNGEWSEEFQDTMLKCFTAKTASDYANETLKQLEET